MKKSLKDLGYCIEEKGTTTLIYKASRPELPSLIENMRDAPPTHTNLSGRAQIRIIEPDLVVRTLTHGGILRHVTGERFLSPARSMRELEISAYLIAKGIPTPEILALVLRRSRFFSHVQVISKLVPDSVDLLTHLEREHPDTLALLENTGSLIRRIHDLGLYHADLHLKNILLDKDRNPWVIDLDKAYRFSSLGLVLQLKTLRRFIHSCNKWEKKRRISLPQGWEDALRDGYTK
ncbi:MAG TPA: lipopolysaccharide kinase InaA family protein [Deltaproteobacteria bacterium]|nr:lipopolysaccharide kinase InaA family protein [Deltaproteobacteria bacterium]HPJ93469.1 lipopolysaccharide kinase InaA family protein [Deltaproteobacteria bacterium]